MTNRLQLSFIFHLIFGLILPLSSSKYSSRISSWRFARQETMFIRKLKCFVIVVQSPAWGEASFFSKGIFESSVLLSEPSKITHGGRTVKKTYWLHFASWEVFYLLRISPSNERRTDPHAKAGFQTGPLIASRSGWCIFWWLDYSSDRTIWNGHQRQWEGSIHLLHGAIGQWFAY